MKNIGSRYTARRLAVYFIGLIILSLGIDLNTKTKLGIAPVISVASNISVITGVMLGLVTFLYYVFMIFLQILIKKKEFKLWQFLQVPCAFVTSAVMQIFDMIIPTPDSLAMRLVFLAGAVLLTAAGAGVVVAMNIVPNPADGLAAAVGEMFGKDYGFGKNIIDFTAIVIALVLGWIFTGGILGIGIGTVISMICIGRVAALLRGCFARIYDWTQK